MILACIACTQRTITTNVARNVVCLCVCKKGWADRRADQTHVGRPNEPRVKCRGGSRGVSIGWLYVGYYIYVIICYYYACDLSYFDVVLCPSSSQILAISFTRKPRPPQWLLASLARVPKVTPSKNRRFANEMGSKPPPHEGAVVGTSCKKVVKLNYF